MQMHHGPDYCPSERSKRQGLKGITHGTQPDHVVKLITFVNVINSITLASVSYFTNFWRHTLVKSATIRGRYL